MPWPKRLTGLCYGGDYNPEQWPEDVWAEDVELMRHAGVNLVSVGVFAWSRLEPVEGHFEFGWLDRVLDLLHTGGIRVALSTPTASPPPWFSLAHPEALPVTADGVRLVHGSRDTYCVSSPAYRRACVRIAKKLAARYGDHPALALWRVHNEYGSRCYCDAVADRFRRWLRERHRDLDGLNEAWATSFWSQVYSDWAQVLPPRATQWLGNPGQLLDFRRFLSDELRAAYREQAAVLRAASPGLPVTTNFVFGDWVHVDHTQWTDDVDLVAIDHYPRSAGPDAEEQGAFEADLARGWAGGGAWLLMESAPNIINLRGRMHTKEPGRLARDALLHVARGSRGAMFFQWRGSFGGAERFHSAMVPHAGPDSRVFREVVELGRVLRALDVVEADVASAGDAGIAADVAVLWDAPSWWALLSPGMPADIDYLGIVQEAHTALLRAGLAADVVPVVPRLDLSGYRLVVVPALYLMSDALATVLSEYVAAGGHLLVTYLTGVADGHARIRLGGYPGAIRDLLGVRVDEFRPLAPQESVPLSTGGHGRLWSESVELAGAEAVLCYMGAPLAGQPAVTRHRYGSGTAWYVSTALPAAAYRNLVRDVAERAGVRPVVPEVPPGLEVIRRRGANASWLFLLNHADEPVRVRAYGVDLLTGSGDADGVVGVGPGALVVIRERPPP